MVLALSRNLEHSANGLQNSVRRNYWGRSSLAEHINLQSIALADVYGMLSHRQREPSDFIQTLFRDWTFFACQAVGVVSSCLPEFPVVANKMRNKEVSIEFW